MVPDNHRRERKQRVHRTQRRKSTWQHRLHGRGEGDCALRSNLLPDYDAREWGNQRRESAGGRGGELSSIWIEKTDRLFGKEEMAAYIVFEKPSRRTIRSVVASGC